MGLHIIDNNLRANASAMQNLAKFMVQQKYPNESIAVRDVFFHIFGAPKTPHTDEKLMFCPISSKGYNSRRQQWVVTL